MASPVGTLNVNLGANTAQFAAGMEAARAKMAAFQKAGQTMGREMGRVGQQVTGMSRSMGPVLQNVGYQVQDMAVQIAGGTSAVRAMSQQLPQLLSGFGLMGVALGTAVAVFAPFLKGLFDSEDAAKKLKDGLKDLEGATRDLVEAAILAATPMEQLRQQYGKNAEAVNALYRAQLEVKRQNFFSAQANAATGVSATIAQVETLTERINELKAGISDPNAQIGAQIELETHLGNLQRQFGLTVEEANALVDAMARWRTAEGPQEIFDAAMAVQEALEASKDEAGKIPEALKGFHASVVEIATSALPLLKAGLGEAADEGERLGSTDVGAGIRGAVGDTNMLIGRLIAAYDAARGIQADLDRKYKQYGGRGGDPRDFMTPGASPFVAPEPAKRGGGGGSRLSDTQREQNKLMQDAQRIYESTWDAVQKYEEALKELNEVYEASNHFEGMGGPATYAKKVQELREELLKSNEVVKTLQGAFENMFSAIQNGASLGEAALGALADALFDVASQMFSSGISNILGNTFGLGSGDLFAGLFGGAKAMGGPVQAGKAYLVGEKGPEIVVPNFAGSVIPNNQLGEIGGGGIHISIDARYATEGTAEMIARTLDRRMPDIVSKAVGGVSAARKRGVPV